MQKKLIYETNVSEIKTQIDSYYEAIHPVKYKEVMNHCMNETFLTYFIFKIVKQSFNSLDIKIYEESGQSLSLFFNSRNIGTNKLNFEQKFTFELDGNDIKIYFNYECNDDFLNEKVKSLLLLYITLLEFDDNLNKTVFEQLKIIVQKNCYRNFLDIKKTAENLKDKTEEEKFQYFLDEFLYSISQFEYKDVKNNKLKNKEVSIEDNKK